MSASTTKPEAKPFPKTKGTYTDQSKKTITKKRVKVEGRKMFLDPNTGEMVPMVVTTVEERDFNFTKLWLQSFLPQLRLIGNKKIDVCMWIIDNLNKDNQLIGTYRQIAKGSGISLETVRATMERLIESDFLRRINNGCYMVNPDIMFKGSKTARDNALFQFRDTNVSVPTSLPKRQRIEELEKNIAFIQKKINELKGEADKEDLVDEACDMQKEWRKVDEESERLEREFEEESE